MRSLEAGGGRYTEEIAALRARVAELERVNRRLTRSSGAERNLDKAWTEWERTFDAARDPIMVLDGDFKILQANLATSRFLGKPLAEVIGGTCWQVVHGTNGPCPECPLMVAHKTRSHEEAQLYVPERDIWIEISVDPILDDQGRIVKVIHIIRDVTERRQARNALDASEGRFRSIFDNANDVVVFVTKLGKILEVNNRVKDVLGYDRDELTGKNVLTSGILAARNAATIARLFKKSVNGGGFPGNRDGRDVTQVWLNHKNGHTVLVEASTTATRKDGKLDGFVSILRDITERRKSRERETQHIRELEFLSESAAAFAQFPLGADLYGYIAGRLKELVPDAIVAVNSYERESSGLRVRELLGLGGHTEALIKLMGANPVGKCFEIDDQAREGLARGELVKIPGGIYDLSPGIPKVVCQGIEKLLGLGDVYGMGLSWKGQLLGSIIILTRSRDELSNRSFVETFIRQAAVALQRAEVEKALLESEERIQAAIDAACLGTWDWNLATERIVWAGHHDRLFSFAPGEFDGRYETFESRIHPDDVNGLRQAIERSLREHIDYAHEYRVVWPDRTTHWVASRGHYRWNQMGQPTRMLGIVSDITDRKRAEEAYRSLVDHSLQGLAIFQDGRIVFANGAMAEITSYTVQEMLDASPEKVQAFVHPEDRELVWRRHEQRLNGEILPERYEIRGIHKDGSVCWLDIQASAIEYQGRPAIQAAYVDITERRKAAESLRESREQLKAIFEGAVDGIVYADRKGNVLEVNPAFTRITGIPREQVVGRGAVSLARQFSTLKDLPQLLKAISDGLMGKPFGLHDLEINNRVVEIVTPALTKEAAGITAVIRDVTDRKTAEKALMESEQRLKILFESAPDGIYLCDLQGNFIDGNRMAVELTGYAREELIGRNFAETGLLWPDEIPKAIANLGKVAAGKPAGPDEFTLRRKDGTQVVVEIRTYPVRINDQMLSLGIARDITERKRAEHLLRKERDKAQQYLDIAAVMMIAVDSERRVGLINDKGCEILGYGEEEILGKNWFDHFLPERVRHEVEAAFEKFVSGQADAAEYFENPILTKDGRERLIAWHNTTLKDDGGNFVAILSSGEDITERRRAEEAMRQSEQKYRELFENAKEAILTFDPQGKITDANKLVEDYGFRREQFIGRPFFDFVVGDHKAKAIEDFETLLGGQPVRGEMDVVTPKGTFTVEYSDNPIIRAGEVVGVQAILMDVTENRKAAEAIKRQTQLSQVFLDSMPCVALLLRPRTRVIVAANKQAEAIGAVPGTTCYGAWAKRESACPWCLAPQVWDTGQSQHLVVEYEGIIWDAHWVPIEEDLYLHYAFDITQRTRVEDALRESEERYRLLFEGSLHPITIYDSDANIVMVNDIGARNLKKPLREIIGKPLGEFIPENHELTVNRVRQVLESGEPLFVEDDISLPDGKRWFLSTLHPVVNPKGQSDLVQIISYDITERKQAEGKLLEYQGKLRAMASEILRAEDRERKRLAVGLHDDICQRLVLTKLAVESSLSLVSNAKLAASLRIAAEAIGETIEEADSLTFELSNPVLREFGLVPALEKYLAEEVRRKHKIACELESDKEIGALSDETRTCLFRVMRELLMNVVRHAHANKIKVCVHKSQGQLRLSVCDDGIGFKREEVNWEVSKKARFGLFSIREQLEYLGGSLEVESEPGRGTTATVVVPLLEKTVV